MATIRKRAHNAIDGHTIFAVSDKIQVVPKTSHVSSEEVDNNVSTGIAIRPILANLKSGQLSHKSIRERLQALSASPFPRQEEWILTYLLGVLGKEQQEQAELEETWLALVDIMHHIPAARLQILLRRTDLVALLSSYFKAYSKVETSDTLKRILCMVKQLQTTRETRRLLSTTFERAGEIVLACTQMLLRRHTLDLSLLDPILEILFFNIKHQPNQKKLLEWMRSYGVSTIVSLIDKCQHSIPNLDRLLQSSIFEESELLNLKSLRDALRQCAFGPGLEHLCSLSFTCVNSLFKNQSKRLTAKNSLLEMWLAIADLKQSASILSRYQDSHNDSNITRPLSSDTTITTALQKLIESAMSQGHDDPSIVCALLELDLDLIIPSHEKALWRYIDLCQSKRLLAISMRSYVQIRSLPVFLSFLLSSSEKIKDIIDDQFLNIVANEIAKMTTTGQREIIQTVLHCDSPLKQTVLVGLVGGLSLESAVFQQNIQDLFLLQGNPDLKRMVALKLKSHPTYETSESQGLFKTAADLEVWLRGKELDSCAGTATVITGGTFAAMRDILVVKENVQLMQAIIERWLPTLVPLLDANQRAEFVGIIAHRSGDPVATDSLLCSQSLLENVDLHSSLQDHFLSLLDAPNVCILEATPIDFFHKGVRRQIVSRLLSKGNPCVADYKVLLKYARAGILPSFNNAQDYSQFACKSLAFSENSSDLAVESLRRIYVKSLTKEQCEELMQSVPLILKIEIIEEKCDSEQFSTIGSALVDDCVKSLQNADEVSSIRYESAIALLRLFKAFSKVSSESKPELRPLKHGSAQVWSRAVQTTSNPDLVLLICEVAAWHAQTLASAVEVLDMAKMFAGQSNSLSNDVLLAFVHTLQLEILYSLLDPNTGYLIQSQHIKLLSYVLQSRTWITELSASWIRQQFDDLCELTTVSLTHEEFGTVLDVLQLILETHARALDISSMDKICLAFRDHVESASSVFKEAQTTKVHRVLRAMFQHHAHRLKDRYHIIILLFQSLLMLSLGASTENVRDSADSYVRLFETFLNSSRALSMTPEQFNKAVAKHVPWLLIEYIHAVTHGTDKLSSQAKTIIEENLVYQCMSLCGQHEREMVGASLDSAGRGLFKRLYDDWSKFGKWTER